MKKLLLILSIIVLSKFGNSQIPSGYTKVDYKQNRPFFYDTIPNSEFRQGASYVTYSNEEELREIQKWLCNQEKGWWTTGKNKTFYSEINIWNDSTGCSTKIQYQIKIKKRLIEITEAEFYKHNERTIKKNIFYRII